MSSIAIVDYGMGNLRSVSQALKHVAADGTRIEITSDRQHILNADKVVFPGQGAARDCMRSLKEYDLVDVVLQASEEKPFLGICMGMQVLMQTSAENDGVDCLGKFSGQVKRFKDAPEIANSEEKLTFPQMGWNQVFQTTDHPLWHSIDDAARFYFVHSYFVSVDDPSLSCGETEYGIRYTSAIAKDSVFAIQCHPEKSADDGLQLLKNFTQWDGKA
ncbi:MAG: Imidazole glycerol phosphate synthase amidotransferase subunit (EC [uncultured Thiotrichaceae bacterium]|uniref:Imidazole glycerol phosphate synthase subunit HisH n=1 Tax=uncultured Thiotrichaceae bacterium TaxID=298394 RepID=A0A6S6T7V9_9GAMM|nr:MAG: Imidazole glycerol phosphate synthase amidotransferase subunit (EC [uncultured Thiotrichaceae bacterium]